MRISVLMRALAPVALLALVPATPVAGATFIDNAYLEVVQMSCNGTSKCLLDTFSAIPSDKVLRNAKMSCLIIMTKSAVLTQVSTGRIVGAGGLTYPFFVTDLTKISEDNTTARYQANGEIIMPLGTLNTRPAFYVSTTNNTSFFNVACVLKGTIEEKTTT